MNLSVIIVTHNSSDVLEPCWRSVRSLIPGAEIIVVDNDSTDDTKRLCEQLGGLTLMANTVNAGFGRACNQGADSASGSHVLFLNPDVEVGEVDLRALEIETDTTPFGLVAPVLKHGMHATQHWTVDLIRHALGPLRPRELPVIRKPVLRRRVWWPKGASLLVQREEFARIGGFDRRFFLYYEDLDLARRYRAAGLPLRITRSVRALHLQGRSSAGESSGAALRQGWSYLSWIEYLYTWYGPETAVRAARWTDKLRTGVNRTLALLERVAPMAGRAGRKRRELADLQSFVRWQSGFGEGTAAHDFCPRAREILAGL